jgi:Tfp pilus assembly protein PilX
MINRKRQKGIALIVTILLMNMLIILSLFFLSFIITEKKIADSQSEGLKAYYLAEAGIAEMVYRLKNNNDYKSNFENDPAWTETFTRDNPFGADSGFYEVSISNTRKAHGEIISIGKINIGNGKKSQRVVKTSVYKALGEGGSDISDKGGYADGNIHISSSQVNFYNGSAHSNNVFNVDGMSTVNIDTDLNAVGNLNKSWLSTLNVGGDINAQNYPPAASEIAMPAVDFDSSDPGAYKNIADMVYSSNDFDNIIKNNNTITLNDPITYVDGDVSLYGGKSFIVNGLLVVGRDFEIGKKLCNGSSCGFPSITINHTEGEASGILAKRKVYFKAWTGEININGVVYASDQLDVLNFPLGYDFYVRGGLISRKLDISSIWKPIDILRDEEIINSTLGIMEFSPVITVEHWEEEY